MNTENNIEIGDRIKEIRIQRGIKQKDLAKILDMPVSTLANYETNRRPVSLDTLNKIAVALDVSVNDLLSGNDKFKKDFNVDEFDSIAKDYILSLQRSLKRAQNNLETDNNLSVTVILQNMIIDFKARYDARKSVNLAPQKWHQFTLDNTGNLITGEKLYQFLYEEYRREYLKEKLENLMKRFEYIKDFDIEDLEGIRRYYEDIPREMMPEYIIKKLYPEEIEKPL